MKATAVAHSNIALVKYWGKRDNEQNLPAVGSISLTLRDLFSKTSVHFQEGLEEDVLYLNHKRASSVQELRVSRFLDRIRHKAGVNWRAEIISENNFPTAAGLASSASAFASLSLAACAALDLKLSPTQLSVLARQGSGSAARSIFGGFVEMKAGKSADGSDAFAVQLVDEQYWDVRMLIIITSELEKAIGSTEGMNRTAESSPYYQAWIKSSGKDLKEIREAILRRDLPGVGEIMEHNCLKMHALALSARPPILYWNSTTIKLLYAIPALRMKGLGVYFTIDAGPQVKVLCEAREAEKVKRALREIPGVERILITSPGPGAKIIEDKN